MPPGNWRSPAPRAAVCLQQQRCALGCLCGYGEQRVHRSGRHRCNRLRLCGYAAAFLSAWQLQQVESASAVLTVTADGLLYGKNGRTLWMALPQFHQDTLVLRRAVLIAGGAFLLNHTLRTVYATAAVSVEPHGLGTAFSDGFVRRALTVYGLPGSVLETYCGTAIPFYPVNSGTCGAETAWQYDLDTTALTISGSGPVADFAADVAPWALFGAEIRQVTVEDGVTALPESSFANCTGSDPGDPGQRYRENGRQLVCPLPGFNRTDGYRYGHGVPGCCLCRGGGRSDFVWLL